MPIGLEELFDRVSKNEKVKGAILIRNGDIIKTSLDDNTSKQFVGFAMDIIERAEGALKRIPDMTGSIGFITVFLRNNTAVLISRYGEYWMIIIASIEGTEIDEVNRLVDNIKSILE